MRIVRAPATIRRIPRALIDARVHAASIVAEANEQARAIVEEAHRQAEEIRERARREGEQAGQAEASAWLVREAARRAAESEKDVAMIADLALEVARTILGREAATGSEVVRDVARRALLRVRRARRIVLRVHPEDVEAARAGCRQWLPAGMEPEVLDVEADPRVDRGGVIVESEIGRLDARLDVQLRALARALGGQ